MSYYSNEQMACPNCGAEDTYQDSADVGVGMIYGPHGCPCGWSESEEYSLLSEPKQTTGGYRIDQWGGATPPGGHV